MKIKTDPDSDDDLSLNTSKSNHIKILDDDKKVFESGGLKLGKVRLTQAEMDAIETEERLQDVHMAAVNHLQRTAPVPREGWAPVYCIHQ